MEQEVVVKVITSDAILYIVLIPLFIFASMILFLWSSMEKNKEQKIKVKYKKGLSKKQELQNRIAGIFRKQSKKVLADEKFYKDIGRSAPPILTVKKIFFLSIDEKDVGKSMTIVTTGAIVSTIFGLLVIPELGIVAGVLVFFVYVTVFITVLNILKINSKYHEYVESVSLLTVIHTQYLNSNNFTEAAKQARDTLPINSGNYVILTRYLERVNTFNMKVTDAIDLLADEMGDLTQVNQYFNIVKKAELQDASLRSALNGIPENLAIMSEDQKDYRGAMGLAGIFWIVSSIAAAIVTVFRFSLPGSGLVLRETGAIEFLYLGLLMLLLTGLVSVYITRSQDKVTWGE